MKKLILRTTVTQQAHLHKHGAAMTMPWWRKMHKMMALGSPSLIPTFLILFIIDFFFFFHFPIYILPKSTKKKKKEKKKNNFEIFSLNVIELCILIVLHRIKWNIVDACVLYRHKNEWGEISCCTNFIYNFF